MFLLFIFPFKISGCMKNVVLRYVFPHFMENAESECVLNSNKNVEEKKGSNAPNSINVRNFKKKMIETSGF